MIRDSKTETFVCQDSLPPHRSTIACKSEPLELCGGQIRLHLHQAILTDAPTWRRYLGEALARLPVAGNPSIHGPQTQETQVAQHRGNSVGRDRFVSSFVERDSRSGYRIGCSADGHDGRRTRSVHGCEAARDVGERGEAEEKISHPPDASSQNGATRGTASRERSRISRAYRRTTLERHGNDSAKRGDGTPCGRFV